jgi:hypothetical protein
MRLLAMVEDPANLARYLAAVGEATEVPPRSPGRGLPHWKSRLLRRQALDEEDDGQGGWVQETARSLRLHGTAAIGSLHPPGRAPLQEPPAERENHHARVLRSAQKSIGR